MNNEIKEILKYIEQFVFVDQSYNETRLSKIDCKLLLDYITNLQDKEKHLRRTRDIMQNYLQLIIDIAYDYDGCNTVKGLKSIIDEIVEYALCGRDMDDCKIIYEEPNGKKYNIIDEEIK